MVQAPGRRLALCASIVVAAYAVASVEVLSAVHHLNGRGIGAAWLLFAVVVAAVAVKRRPALTRPSLAGWSRPDLAIAAVVGLLLLAELVLALGSAPNTYDSQTYHLPRIEHWLALGSVEPFAVRIHRQVTYPPGAEYVLLHLRVLTGGDALYALLQFGGGLLCLAAATRLAAQFGGGRRAQLLTALVLSTVPTVALEASSTQTDLIVAGYVGAFVTLALDGLGPIPNALVLGCAAGLVTVTKPTGMLVVAPILAWAMVRHIRSAKAPHGWTDAVFAGIVVLAGTAALAGPHLWRMDVEFGNPLGPQYLRDSISMQRHDPAAIAVNGLRQAQTIFDVPLAPARRMTAGAVTGFAHAVGIDPSEPAITFDGTTFPAVAWYPSEDKASFPAQALLLVAATAVALLRRGNRVYAALLVLAAVLHAATVKWQPWGNRLVLYLVVLAAPLAGLWLADLWGANKQLPPAPLTQPPLPPAALKRPRPQRILAGLTALVVLAGVAAGWLSVGYGWPRRLVGHQSVFTLDRWHQRFVTRPAWAEDYATAGAAVRASGARTIGVVESNDSWEYPWWVQFRGREVVALQSQFPRHPPAKPADVDAVVCVIAPGTCRQYIPAGWPTHTAGIVTYATRPPS